jgi:cell division protein FtsA
MKHRDDGLMTVLDVGSNKVVCLAAELHEGALRYRGHGIAESRGMRRGVVSELGPASACMREAVEAAEKIAGGMIAKAVIGVGGPHVRGVNSCGGITLGSRMREITREEVRAAVDRARSVSLEPDRDVLHLLPQEFVLDHQSGIHDPVGMIGSRLEVNLHMSTCGAGIVQSVVTAANRAGVEVEDTVYEGVASAEGVLSADERELGICLADIGAGSTELIVYYEGAVAHTAVLPIGGDHFTNDLAVGLRITVAEAERLKLHHGHAVVTAVPQLNQIELPTDADHKPRSVSLRLVAEILEARATELMKMLRDNLRNGGVLEALGAGCVLTGGGACLPGMLDIAENTLRVQARVGTPVPISRMPSALGGPEFSTVLGMMLYTHRKLQSRAGEDTGLRAKLRARLFAGSL